MQVKDLIGVVNSIKQTIETALEFEHYYGTYEEEGKTYNVVVMEVCRNSMLNMITQNGSSMERVMNKFKELHKDKGAIVKHHEQKDCVVWCLLFERIV